MGLCRRKRTDRAPGVTGQHQTKLTNGRDFITGRNAGASLIALHPYSARAAAGQAHLRIMGTTDIHMHVYPYDYYSDRPVNTGGLARTAAHIDAIRAEATNSLLLDNGDFLQGTPMADYIAYERGMKEGDLHPVIAALNAIGLDAATIGNHEFNYGLDFLMKSMAGARFPVVLANIATAAGADPRADRTLFRPYVILDRRLTDGAGNTHPIRVGVIGFTPPQVMNWDRRHLEGRVVARDIVETARALVPQMQEDGADIVIALSHSGIGAAAHTEGMENASVPLAAVAGIDAVITGHTHLVFPSRNFPGAGPVDGVAGRIHGKPAVMGGFWGSHLGVIDLLLQRDGNAWQVVNTESQTHPIARRNNDRSITPPVQSENAVLASVAADHAATLAYVRRAVGRTTAPLHSYFALVADDPSIQAVANAQIWYMKQVLRGTPHEGVPVLSATAPFKAGGRGGPEHYTDIPAGDVTIGNVADLYLYPNTVRAVRVTGAQVKDWLERSAGMFNRITPGAADQVLLNRDFPSYNFDVIDGVEYQIDLGQPSKYATADGALADPDANRIVGLSFGGRPLAPDEEFIIATNNFRASGGGNFPGADGATVVFEAPDTIRDVIVRHIVEHGTINPQADGNWRFRPMPGTTVLFDTGPGAARYADSVPGVALEPAGDGPDGFTRFRIFL